MTQVDISAQRALLLGDQFVVEQLPQELLTVIRDHSSIRILDAVATAALIPQLTDRIFVYFENLFPDICARWILRETDEKLHIDILSAFAKILPFAPCLSSVAEDYLKEFERRHPDAHKALFSRERWPPHSDGNHVHEPLLRSLLAVWRLNNFDQETFSGLLRLEPAQLLFHHPDEAVRYVAIRIFSQLLHASDAKLERLISQHLPDITVPKGDFDGRIVNYTFLSLWESDRAKEIIRLRQTQTKSAPSGPPVASQPTTPGVACYGQAMIPRPRALSPPPPSLVRTSSTNSNLEKIATLLQRRDPILLFGPAGSGKSALVCEIARSVGAHDRMVTMHLNQQTDAKVLVGLYTSDSASGSFQWRPGILTTAVKEGRWVLIEDLDKAPQEVISTLLPLIERRELVIPNRAEKIRAPAAFRLFATIRSSQPSMDTASNILGARFWQSAPILASSVAEIEEIVLGRFPMLRKYSSGIIAVYQRVAGSGVSPKGSTSVKFLSRSPSLRDLLKWCRRLVQLLLAAGCVRGDEPVSTAVLESMFLEAVDCFLGSLPESRLKEDTMYEIAQEMHLSREKVDFFLTSYVPSYEDVPKQLKIGRISLQKSKNSSSVAKPRRPFASTSHAKRLLEQVAVAVNLGEPVLLVGETGIGKTTVVQQLAEKLGSRLVVVNLSQQSESSDLLGGFKPVNVRSLATPLRDEFDELFSCTGLSASKNEKFLEQIRKTFAKSQWKRTSKLWREAPKMFRRILDEVRVKESKQQGAKPTSDRPLKRQKTDTKSQRLQDLLPRWDAFDRALDQFDLQLAAHAGTMAFSFVEGNIVKAARNGDWVLLDEINLATPDTLESISDLLVELGDQPSVLLSETGEIERIKAHPNFRIFGSMNPATDIGKRDLPAGIRSRFTEIFVSSPDRDLKDLVTIIRTYLGVRSNKEERAVDDIARLYLNVKRLAEEKRLVDGANEVPHFSLRTLTRVLAYVNDVSAIYGLQRSLFEGFSMGFLTLLNKESEDMLTPLLHHHLLDSKGGPKFLLSQPPRNPNDGREYVRFKCRNKQRQYFLLRGEQEPRENADYIITPYVERNLLNVVRATSTRRFPILIQGPTSSGKTSMIQYLADFSGNKFVRINNHEHTDLQEYLGTYVSGSDGKLRFQEGLLVEAMRKGYWIVLDELNLAPTDVLEALNRLLDDNRELLIPETQEVVRPHENFILFATQNPPSLYGGRKILSRAFRNRFLELHFDDIPQDELQTILQQRSRNTSPSDCQRIVAVYKELSRLRQTSRLFEQKDSFATLRDLFRWALRDADTREQIAANGFMLLAERVRNGEERETVKGVIESVFKVTIQPESLYDAQILPSLRHSHGSASSGAVLTRAMRRLLVLVSAAIRNNEPVLLVGDTGCGKTTVCQILAEQFGKDLRIVNAHQNLETGDLIGSQRPVRNRGAVLKHLESEVRSALDSLCLDASGQGSEILGRYHSLTPDVVAKLSASTVEEISALESRAKALFEWVDGGLVEAMKTGNFFLLDEISLAEDSVLERLNSVLEPERSILLAEKGSRDSFVQASDGFQFLATMNPGGDFGKKELSPALRNRFTEIWVPQLSAAEDIEEIVRNKLQPELRDYTKVIVDFAEWFGATFRSGSSTAISIRDLLVWVEFMNRTAHSDTREALLHGAATVYIDGLGANPSALIVGGGDLHRNRQSSIEKLSALLGSDVSPLYHADPDLVVENDIVSIGSFSLPRVGQEATFDSAGSHANSDFAFHAPTTRRNAMRVVRALQMSRPILLEGSPGVGKTTLVTAIAKACAKPLTRINLSDQTDLMDLFGADTPVDGEEAGNFAWRDAPFLQAMKNGEWVLLDEMNLASQSVLEGLNACLDHRGEVYVAELDMVFKRHPNFRVFAAQNPHHQGGGRKGLPASFVNRFVLVYADALTKEDMLVIASHTFPKLSLDIVRPLIDLISQVEHEVVTLKSFGAQGGPWEFNLRDTLRWLQLLSPNDQVLATGAVADFVDICLRLRFRTEKDRREITRLFDSVFDPESTPRGSNRFYHDINSSAFQVGLALLPRDKNRKPVPIPKLDPKPRLSELESVMICAQQNIPCIISGPSGSGKSIMLEYVASLAGKSLVVFPINADTDAMDLVGGFEQADPQRDARSCIRSLEHSLEGEILGAPDGVGIESAFELLQLLRTTAGVVDSAPAIVAAIKQLEHVCGRNTSLGRILSGARKLLQKPLQLSAPRFEWLDGIIVRAIEQGEWLVLDNANLCSASVLDRLNSLMEPKGFLSINEHCEPGGEPRIVKPHPDFRVFLTVDPRNGELSRAMRNRAIEIHIEPVGAIDAHVSGSGVAAPVEGGLVRFQAARECSTMSLGGGMVPWENLASTEMPMVPLYLESLKGHGQAEELSNSVRLGLRQFLDCFSAPFASSLSNEVLSLYKQTIPDHPTVVNISKPVHPLNNAAITRLFRAVGRLDEALWLGTRMDVLPHIRRLRSRMESEAHKSKSTRMSDLNRFQRSCLLDEIPNAGMDSTAKVASFLHRATNDIEVLFGDGCVAPSSWEFCRWFLKLAIVYMNRTISLTTNDRFDEATFLAHVSQGTKIFSAFKVAGARKEVQVVSEPILAHLRDAFRSGLELSTGLSMEALWKHFRHGLISTELLVQQSAKIECLAARFDSLRWTTKSPLSSLMAIQESFCRVYGVIRKPAFPATQLLEDLSGSIDAIQGMSGKSNQAAKPVLEYEFEILRKLSALHDLGSKLRGRKAFSLVNQKLRIMSNFPTTIQMRHDNIAGSAAHLHEIDYLFPLDPSLSSDCLVPSVLAKMDGLAMNRLDSLSTLEKEVPFLGLCLSQMASSIARGAVLLLHGKVATIILDCAEAHDLHVKDSSNCRKAIEILQSVESSLSTGAVSQALHESQPTHFTSVLSQHFRPAICDFDSAGGPSAASMHSLSLACVHASIGLLKLYVPDRSFDPHLPQQLEHQIRQDQRAIIEAEKQDILTYELHLTGRNENLRLKMLEDDLAQVGTHATTSDPPFRPANSQIGQIQVLFRNIINLITTSGVETAMSTLGSGDDQAASDLVEALLSNVTSIRDRLSTSFESYQDMTLPVTSMLRLLEVGLTMGIEHSRHARTPPSAGLSSLTPFMGGKLWQFELELLPTHSLELFEFLATIVAVEGTRKMSPEARNPLLRSLHSFYLQWKKKVEDERKQEEQRTSLYRFRGSLEDEQEHDEEEFNELFPTGEGTRPTQAAVGRTIRAMTVSVANAHRRLFLEPLDPLESIQNLCETACRHVPKGADAGGERLCLRDSDCTGLPGAIFTVDKKLASLNQVEVAGSYNFYRDANIPEMRLLAQLLEEVEARFTELQMVDEIGHMQPLADVLDSCERVRELPYSTELSAMLPRVENLHLCINEWQYGGWASHVHLVPSLHKTVTDTIVRWRRLELSTWSKLFDMEVEKCRDDAKSWWFMAYELIVAAPMSMVDSEDQLAQYARNLVRDLEAFFSQTVLGQYSERLTLLRQLREHLDLLAEDHRNLRVVSNALLNFVDFYSRYESVAQEAIRKGRNPLEKGMRDVLLLASWKDTNVNALRESARRSHLKLFRLVRKFRQVLSQPTNPILEQGLGAESSPGDSAQLRLRRHDDRLLLQLSDAGVRATLSVVQAHRRLANAPTTVKVMVKLARLPDTKLSGGEALDTFVQALRQDISELRKETPSTLTEENTAQVKHLKTRKRKLFADTMRSVRHMGFRHTLSPAKLQQQESLATIFAGVEPVTSDESRSTDSSYHRLLELLPKTRLAAKNHSEDLTEAEVSRSIGYLESITNVILRQRRFIALALEQSGDLESTFREVASLANVANSSSFSVAANPSNWDRVLNWLVWVISFGIQLVEAHSRLGEYEDTHVLEFLRRWLEEFESCLRAAQDAGLAPAKIASSQLLQAESRFLASLAEFEAEIGQLQSRCNDVTGDPTFIVNQILNWTTVSRSSTDIPPPTSSIEAFAARTSQTCDKILVATERLGKEAAGLPETTEDSGWVVTLDSSLRSAVQILHMKTIQEEIHGCVQELMQLDLADPSTSQAAKMVLCLAVPIWQQHIATCRDRLLLFWDFHQKLIRMACVLFQSFGQIANEGFCTPAEQSDEKSGQEGKVESGTGLGDGEGQNDISKDIQEDEDLSELAQEPNKDGGDGEIEDEKDAVDMAGEDLEGDMGSAHEDEEDEKDDKGGDEGDDDEIDEEAGDVDDLDPNTVDEKMWEGEGDEADKEQKGRKDKGKREDEEVAAENGPEEGPDGGEDQKDLDAAADEAEEVQHQDDKNMQDQNVEESEALVLPDDMDLDKQDESDGLSEGDEDTGPEEEMEEREGEGSGSDMEMAEENHEEEAEQEPSGEADGAANEVDEDTEPDAMSDVGAEDPEEAPKPENEAKHETAPTSENVVPADAQAGGQDRGNDDMDVDQTEETQNADQQQDDHGASGAKGETKTDAQNTHGQSEQTVQDADQSHPSGSDEAQARQDPFKKLGDVLEKWYQQQNEINQASEAETLPPQHQDDQETMGSREFQHLQNDDAAADAQALGSAKEEEVQPFDDAMAIDEDNQDPRSQVVPEDQEEAAQDEHQADERQEPQQPPARDQQESEAPSGVKTRQGAFNKEVSPPREDVPASQDVEESVNETSDQLIETHISDGQDSPLRDLGEAMQQWAEFQTRTHGLSVALTSQLRLILTPSQATKLSGAHRTGKRLNIKRIIPYIASGYKRDKIWMRRSVPTKRNYQILLCVDDSKSMGESSSGTLALESLVMVSRALSMLEAGQIGILGFGASVFSAHELDAPFSSSEAGGRVLRSFSFRQDRTDIRLLVRDVIDRFREARLRSESRSSGGEDLWQLALVLSDGLTPSAAHDGIRRLLREAMEEKIMVVFIVMDDVGKKSGESVLELREARFVKDESGGSSVVIERYLDTFPFQYYLIVHHLEDLPGALASLLRTWFAEVSS